MQEVIAALDVSGSERNAFYGTSEGGAKLAPRRDCRSRRFLLTRGLRFHE